MMACVREKGMRMLSNFVWSIVTKAPPVKPAAPPGAEKILKIVGWVSWTVTVMGIVGILAVACYMMFRNDRGEGSNATSKLAYVLGGLILVSAASAIVGVIV